MKKLLSELTSAPVLAWAGTTALVLLFAIVPASSFHLDDNSAENDAAADAIAQQRQEEHLAKAGKAICGDNAAWVRIDERTIQCLTHRGAKTITAKVAP